MPENQPKRKRPKLKRLNITTRDKWNRILSDVEKKEVPISFLQSVTVNLIDGTKVDINIKEFPIQLYTILNSHLIYSYAKYTVYSLLIVL